MVEKMSSDNSSNRASNALLRRAESIKKWKSSDTATEKPVRLPNQFTIKFDKGTVFLSAVASGEIDETKLLLDGGVDIDYTNVDGLTALHQACIDENEDMVNLLLDRKANIEARDNEGWTPLHAAASAGNVDIAQILIDRGADLASVNNEGEVPLDLAEEEDMEDFLSEEIDAQDLEVDDARNEEERIMIEDANSWVNKNKVDETLDWQGATALHVAAAKGYNKVISLLLQIGATDVNVRDNDGWTPIHAAVHWGSKTACELLTEAGANFDLKNSNGQTPCDLAEPEFVKTAENCRKRSKEVAKKPNFTKNKRIDVSIDVNDNSLLSKEIDAIELLKKVPPRPAVKGGRASAKANNGNKPKTQLTNDKKVTNKKSESPEGESDGDSDAENRPATVNATVNVNLPIKTTTASSKRQPSVTTESVSNKNSSQNSALRPSSLTNRDDKKDTKPTTPISVNTKFGNGNRFQQKEPEKVEPKKFESKKVEVRKEEPATTNSKFSVSSNRLPSRTETKTEEKKPEEVRPSRFGTSRPTLGSSSKVEKEDDNQNSRIQARSKLNDTDNDSRTRKKEETNADTTKSSIFVANRTGGSDWRSRLAERSKDAENDVTYTRPSSKFKNDSETSLKNSEEISHQNEPESNSPTERISPHSRRVAHRNLRETRRSTGVVFLPEKDDQKVEDENEPSEPETKRTTSATDDSRMSIAERLRKKNAELLSSSDRTDRTSDRTSVTDRPSSISDRYTSSRDNTSSASVRTASTRISSTSTSSSDTGDTKDLQRKLDQAVKEVQDYKSKYEKMKQEKEDLEKQIEQYKEDIDKMQELKNDNLRLKDENGALIRVISKLSRTPAS